MVASSLVGLGSLGALLHIAGSVLIVFGQVGTRLGCQQEPPRLTIHRRRRRRLPLRLLQAAA